jgi:hypothetical protein
MVIVQRKNQRKKWIEIVSRDNFWEKFGLIIDICCIPESQPPKKNRKRKEKRKNVTEDGWKCQSERRRERRRRRVEHTDGERESG